MKHILFIVPYPEGTAPSQRFRFEQYLSLLRIHGYSYHISSFWSPQGWRVLYSHGHTLQKTLAFIAGLIRRFWLIFRVPRYKVVFIHREALPVGPPVIEWVIAKLWRKRIVYDFDDAIWLPNTSRQNRMVSVIKNHGKVKYICSWSWKVSCGNGYLANFAGQYCDRTVVNPTTIDTAYHVPLIIKNTTPPPVIGWTGTHSTMRYLHLLVPVFKRLKKIQDFRIHIISNQPPYWDFDDYLYIPWNQHDEIAQLQQFDIGLMPLEDTDWERGKCGFKALQYMALEIPVVASAVGVNLEIIEDGRSGFLCKTQDDWYDSLLRLLESGELRQTLGTVGRRTVQSRYSVQSNADRFLGLFA